MLKLVKPKDAAKSTQASQTNGCRWAVKGSVIFMVDSR